MKKNNILFTVMSIIGLLCTAICLCYVFRDRLKETSLFRKFFGEEEDDLDEFFDDFEDEDPIPEEMEETTQEEEAVSEEPQEEEATEEEAPAPKVRRGYIPLRFPSEQSA